MSATPRRSLAGRVLAAALGLLVLAVPTGAAGRSWGPWSTPVLETGINSPQADGCPIESLDGRRLFFASTREGAVGGTADGNDIWVVERDSVGAPWGPAAHLPEPVNSAAADFCPTPLPGGHLFFVSSRSVPGACGAGDIFRTREHPVLGWLPPEHLACATSGGPNFGGGEFSPSVVETPDGTLLYYSSPGPDGPDQDIFVSRQRADGSFGPGMPVDALNTPANDQMPNVRRDGLEIVFASDRPGGAGTLDIYTATRASTSDPWSAPTNLGPGVNTAAAESRPSLSGDRERLHFGRLGDIWVSTRSHE